MVKVRPIKPLIPKKDSAKQAMWTVQTILPYADLIWAPIALIFMERGVKLKTCGFVLSCSLLLRLQTELLQQIGMGHGLFGLMESSVFVRGQVTYSVFILFFLILAWFSKGVDKHVHLAASISILIFAFCVSSVIMVL
jgi:hypothetical protein